MSAAADIPAEDRVTRFGIVGAGLIGGSIAKAIAAADGAATIALHDVKAEHRTALAGSVPAARPVERLAELADCRCVFVCTPVSTIAGIVRSLAGLVGEDAVIVDCGSVKGSILKALESDGGAIANYVPGHPMRGGTGSGPAFADASIIAGSPFVLCPGPETDALAVARAEAILVRLGALPVRSGAEAHDRALALTSHLPHLLAFGLAASLEAGEPVHPGLVAGSFRNVSRYAASDAGIWTDIFRANRPQILEALGRFESELADLRARIEAGEEAALEGRLAELARLRRALDD